MIASSKKFLDRHMTVTSTARVCTRVVQGKGAYARIQAHYRPRVPLFFLKKGLQTAKLRQGVLVLKTRTP